MQTGNTSLSQDVPERVGGGRKLRGGGENTTQWSSSRFAQRASRDTRTGSWGSCRSVLLFPLLRSAIMGVFGGVVMNRDAWMGWVRSGAGNEQALWRCDSAKQGGWSGLRQATGTGKTGEWGVLWVAGCRVLPSAALAALAATVAPARGSPCALHSQRPAAPSTFPSSPSLPSAAQRRGPAAKAVAPCATHPSRARCACRSGRDASPAARVRSCGRRQRPLHGEAVK